MMKEKEKKAHGVQLLIRAVVRDPDGKIITDTGRTPSRSFVIQFLEFIYFAFDGPPGDSAATDTSGNETTIYASGDIAYVHHSITAIVNIDTHGSVVGTGDTAETNADYKLATQLTEGAGAGNITHGAQVVEAVAEVGANVDLETKRSFINNTGSSITVKEAGIYAEYFDVAGYERYHCIIRDVLAASVEVPDKCSLTVYYTLRTTV